MSPRVAALFSVVASVSLSGGCQFDVGKEPLGSFDVSWVLLVDDQPGECEEAGAARVRVSYEARAEGYLFRDTFPCEPGWAEAAYLPLADYEVTPRLLDAEDREIERGDPMEVSLAEAESITPLPTVTFRVDTRPIAER